MVYASSLFRPLNLTGLSVGPWRGIFVQCDPFYPNRFLAAVWRPKLVFGGRNLAIVRNGLVIFIRDKRLL